MQTSDLGPRTSALECAAARAYNAFLGSLKELAPPGTPPWNDLPPRLRAAWTAAAEAIQTSEV
jgi:hypothetical protein